MIRLFLYAVCCLIIGCTSTPDITTSTVNPSPIKRISTSVVDSFFVKLSKGQADEAITWLLSTNENILMNDSSTIQIRNNFLEVNNTSGTFVDYRLLKERIIQDDIVMYSYLVRYEKKYYRFIFEFYNNGKATKLYKFLFDSALDIELEESLKFYAE